MVRTRSVRLPQCRAAPVPSGPVVGGLRPPFLVERGLLVVAVVRLPQCRVAPVPSGPVVGGLRPPFLVERGLLVVAVVVRVSDMTAVKRNDNYQQ